MRRHSSRCIHKEDGAERYNNIHNKVLAEGEKSHMALTGQITVYQVGAKEMHITLQDMHMPSVQCP